MILERRNGLSFGIEVDLVLSLEGSILGDLPELLLADLEFMLDFLLTLRLYGLPVASNLPLSLLRNE